MNFALCFVCVIIQLRWLSNGQEDRYLAGVFFFTDCTIFVVIDSCHLGHSKEEYAQEDSGEHITAEI